MIAGILFDKDGTLFDFQATWGRYVRALVEDLADGNEAKARRLALAVGYEMDSGRFAPDSPVIAHTPDEIALALLPHLPGKAVPALVAQMNAMSAQVVSVPAVPLAPLLSHLRARGLRLGVATNDAEAAARAQFHGLGIAEHFDFIAGFDSGHGGKPRPGMLQAFARQYALPPEQVVMVGDSGHDLLAGRLAGMRTIAVLTGPTPEAELARLADTVLPDIGHLPHWLDLHQSLETAE